jgi:outer membrane protein assembly factor BamB
LGTIAAGENWSRFRGPNGEGHATGPFTKALTEKDIDWKIALPGIGHSSPVVWGDHVYVTSADTDKEARHVLCFNPADGSKLWEFKTKFTSYRKHRDNSFASATPAADELGVYVVFTMPQEFLLLALDHSGKERWRKSLGRFESQHGSGSSPIIHGDLVILNDDQESPGSALLAFDRKTGEPRWKLDRRSTKKAAMSTPTIWKPRGGDEQIVITTWGGGIQGVDPKTGKLLWSASGVFFSRPIGSPQTTDELIVGVCGEGNGVRSLVTIKPNPAGGEPKQLYKIDQLGPHVPSPIIAGDRLILLNDLGEMTCADLATGKTRWTEKVGATFYGSPILVGDTLWAISRQGELYGIDISQGYKLLGKLSVGGPSQTTPAIADGRMFIRTTTQLLCIKPK